MARSHAMRPVAYLTHLGPGCTISVDVLLGRIVIDNGQTVYTIINLAPESLRFASESVLEGAV
jgi:hypothetical protein